MNKWILLVLVCGVGPVAWAKDCDLLAKPSSFNSDTAMEAIFCDYNREHRATLLPLRHTDPWHPERAAVMATPLLVAIYRENDKRKAVLVVQRQGLEESGEPVSTHVLGAMLSVYIFQFDGSHWVYEKGKKEVLTAGAHGNAPGGKLIKLGADKFGVWLEGGDVHQGYTNDYAYIVTLSDDIPMATDYINTGESNRGTCSDDPAERDDGLYACWETVGKPEFIDVPGQPYYLLRIAYTGTEQKDPNDRNHITDVNVYACYEKQGNSYVTSQSTLCQTGQAIDAQLIFGVGKGETGQQPIMTIPRKYL